MTLQSSIRVCIDESLKALGLSLSDIHLEHPQEVEHGDYATSVALVLAKQEDENPRDMAERIKKTLEKKLPPEVERVEIAGPGFINFHLRRLFFADAIGEILAAKEAWGRCEIYAGKKAMVEYTDANPFKEFHLGHLMTNVIGESIARIIVCAGAEVKRANYQGDTGLHVAKAMYGMMRLEGDRHSIAAWGEAYARGASAYEDETSAKGEIEAINKNIYEGSDAVIQELYRTGRETSLAHFEEIYKKLGTAFDFYFFESETGPRGLQIVKGHLGDVFEESEGAIIYRGEKKGLHTRVFVNSQGLPTYEAKELGLAAVKQEIWAHDMTIVVTAHEIKDYFAVLKAALSDIAPDIADKITHIGHGFLRLPSGKMSSRKGTVITGESLIEELAAAAREKITSKTTDEDERTLISQAVAVAAIKYSILKQSPGKDIIFEKEKSLSFEGDSGPYLQYAHVRSLSVLKKAAAEGIVPSVGGKIPSEVTLLEKLLYQFPEEVERSASLYDPHYIAQYLTELAGAFNSYYAKQIIVDDTPEAPYRVALTSAFENTMRNGLSLLGIRPLERM